LKACVSHEPLGRGERFLIVTRQWNSGRLARPMRLAREILVVDCVERAHEAHSREELRRGNARALAARLNGHLAVACRIRIARGGGSGLAAPCSAEAHRTIARAAATNALQPHDSRRAGPPAALRFRFMMV